MVVLSAVGIMSLWLFSCAGGKRSDAEKLKSSATEEAKLDSISSTPSLTDDENTSGKAEAGIKKDEQQPVSSSAARLSYFDSTRKIIRTAELKFKAKNVVKTSYVIEDIVSHFGGFISSSEIRNEINRTQRTPFSDDSAVKSTYYTISAEIAARVPSQNLDSSLKALAPLIDFLDYRNIKTQDLTLDFMRQELQRKHQARYQQRVTTVSDSKEGTANDRLAAEDRVLQSQIAADEAMLQNLETQDKIAFSQINISLYQEEMIKTEKVAERTKSGFFSSGFGYRMQEAFFNGWSIIRFLMYFLLTLWPLWLLGAAIWIAIRYFKKIKK